MSHMVIFRSADGQPVYSQVESLEDAARHVESLRNAGQGGDARIFRLHEIPMEVKTYYRVEVSVPEQPAADPAPAAPAASATPAPAPVEASEAPTAPAAPAAVVPPAPAAAPTAVKPEPATAGASANGGRFGLFGKG